MLVSLVASGCVQFKFIHRTGLFDCWWAHSVKIDFFSFCCTVGSKIIRALAIVLATFLCFDCQFLSSLACYILHKAQRSWLCKYLCHKIALDMSFLTRLISSARIILLLTVFLTLQISVFKLMCCLHPFTTFVIRVFYI